MATRFYLSRKAPTFTPTNFRGSWGLTTSFAAGSLALTKDTSGGNYSQSQFQTQTDPTNPYDTCNYRLVSAPLASAITISGTVDSIFASLSFNNGQSQYTRIYIYVTSGDTDTVRGVLLDYAEPSGTSGKQWAKIFSGAVALTQQTVSSVAASVGDRIVIELGSRNYTTTTNSSLIGTGTCNASTSLPFTDDLSATNTTPANYAGWIELSDDLYFASPIRTSQFSAEILSKGTPAVRTSQFAAEILSKGTPAIRTSQFAFEVISRAYVPGDVLQSVTSTSSIVQSLATSSVYLKTVETDLSVTTDTQVASTAQIERTASSSVSVSQTIDFRLIPLEKVTSAISVTPTVTLTDSGPHLFVAHTVFTNSFRNARNSVQRRSVTSTVTVTPSNRFSPIVETLTTAVTTSSLVANSTPDHARTIQTNAAVAQNIVFNVPAAVNASSNINISQGISYTNTSKYLTVSSNITITHQVTKRGPVPNSVTTNVLLTPSIIAVGNVELTVTTNVGATQTTAPRNTNPQVTIPLTVTVNQTIDFHNTGVPKTVTTPVNITSTNTSRNNIVRKTVTSNIIATQHNTARNSVIRIALTSSLGISLDKGNHSDTAHIKQVDLIKVTDVGQYHLPNVRGRLVSLLSVDSSYDYKSTVIRLSPTSHVKASYNTTFATNQFSLADAVSVATDIYSHSDFVRLTVESLVTVIDEAKPANTNPRITVVTNVKYNEFPGGSPAAYAWNSNTRITVPVIVYVDAGITGGVVERKKLVTTLVQVNHIPRNNQIFGDITSKVTVVEGFVGGPDPRRITVEEQILVTPTVRKSLKDVAIAVKDDILVTPVAYGRVKTVIEKVTSFVQIYNIDPSARIVLKQNIISPIFVNQSIVDYSSRYSRSDSLSVTQKIGARNTVTRSSVTSNIHVTHRAAIFEHEVKSKVTVGSWPNMGRYFNIIHKMTPIETLTVTRLTDINIIQPLDIVEETVRVTDLSYSFTDTIHFPEKYFEKHTSIGTIFVPILRSYGMDNFVTLQTNNSMILLPPPEFDDSENVVSKCKVMRSMNAAAYTIIRSSDRKKLNYPFKLALPKADELRIFLINNMSKPMYITDWKNQQWYGVCTTNPFTITAEAAFLNQRERLSVELEFEAVKL